MAHALRLQAEIAAHREPADPVAAAPLYHRAIASAEELGMRPLVARCRLGLGRLHATVGQRPLADGELTEARRLFRDMGMAFWVDQADGVLDGSTHRG